MKLALLAAFLALPAFAQTNVYITSSPNHGGVDYTIPMLDCVDDGLPPTLTAYRQTAENVGRCKMLLNKPLSCAEVFNLAHTLTIQLTPPNGRGVVVAEVDLFMFGMSDMDIATLCDPGALTPGTTLPPPTPTPQPEPPPPPPTIYETDFTADVSADWSLTRVTQEDAALRVDGGWGVIGWAELAGASRVSARDVTAEATMLVGAGNVSAYAELAARAQGATDGVSVRVYGSWSDAVVELRDGPNILDSRIVTGLRSQLAPVEVSLVLEGDTATATIRQAAGVSGSQSWADVTATLGGSVTTSVGPGNVRFAGRSYTARPKLTAIRVTWRSATAR